ncbi:MAG: hypothetical protein U5K00_12150 [Melioribacteraceae bacterium]|nr:hypothetical protein [Melioribacteraceae bacterium]
MIRCEVCGTENKKDLEVCEECGAPLSSYESKNVKEKVSTEQTTQNDNPKKDSTKKKKASEKIKSSQLQRKTRTK